MIRLNSAFKFATMRGSAFRDVRSLSPEPVFSLNLSWRRP